MLSSLLYSTIYILTLILLKVLILNACYNLFGFEIVSFTLPFSGYRLFSTGDLFFYDFKFFPLFLFNGILCLLVLNQLFF
jgi:hypothetical protein